MNIKYNYDCLRLAMVLSAVSFVAWIYYYLFENSHITGPDNAGSIALILFYTCAAISAIMVWTVSLRREILEKKLKSEREKYNFLMAPFSSGVLSFFSNKYAVAVDILLGVVIVNLLLSCVLRIMSACCEDILEVMALWLFYMHGILNGRNYALFKKLFEIESKADKK